MKIIMLICVSLLTACAGPLTVKTVTTSEGLVTTTKSPAKVQAWSADQRSLRDVQLKVLDLLIAKENSSRPKDPAPVVEPKDTIEDLVINMGEDEEGNAIKYTLTYADIRKLNAARDSDDSAKATTVSGIRAMKEVALAVIESKALLDPALAGLLRTPGASMPETNFVSNTKAIGGLIGPYIPSFFSGLFGYLMVDSAMSIKESQIITKDYKSFDYQFKETLSGPLE